MLGKLLLYIKTHDEISIDILSNSFFTKDEAIEAMFLLSQKCKLEALPDDKYRIVEIIDEDLKNQFNEEKNAPKEETKDEDDDDDFDDYFEFGFDDDDFDDEDIIEDNQSNELNENEQESFFSIDDLREELSKYFQVEKAGLHCFSILMQSPLINNFYLYFYYGGGMLKITDDSIIYNLIFNPRGSTDTPPNVYDEIEFYLKTIRLRNAEFSYYNEFAMSFEDTNIPRIVKRIFDLGSIIQSIFMKYDILLDRLDFSSIPRNVLFIDYDHRFELSPLFKASYTDFKDELLEKKIQASSLALAFVYSEEVYTKDDFELFYSLTEKFGYRLIFIKDTSEVSIRSIRRCLLRDFTLTEIDEENFNDFINTCLKNNENQRERMMRVYARRR